MGKDATDFYWVAAKMLLNILHYTGQSPTTSIVRSQVQWLSSLAIHTDMNSQSVNNHAGGVVFLAHLWLMERALAW